MEKTMLLNLNLAKAQGGNILSAQGEIVVNSDILETMCDDCDNICKVNVEYCYNGEYVECRGNGLIHLKGNCYRCGEKVDALHEFEFEDNILPADSNVSDDAYYFKGDTVDITKLVEDSLITSLPLQLLCKVDCKGLCPHCYTNLNFGVCECAEDTSNSPFAVLNNIK